MSDWILKLPWDVINTVSEGWDIDPRLVGAMVQVESRGNPFLCRFEPSYPKKWLVDPKEFAKSLGQTFFTERVHQKTSWGLLQIMGATARDEGYEAALSILTTSYEGLVWGCKYLKKQQKRYNSVYGAVAAYNAGSVRLLADGTLFNQEYVDRVRDHAIQLDLHIPKEGPPKRGTVLNFKKP